MADEHTETPPPAPEREGVPGSEVLGLAANGAALALTALGGWWLWIAGGILAAAVGGVAWNWRRKRRGARHGGAGRAGARSGAARSLGWRPGGRSGTGRGAGGRPGAGRRAGGLLGGRRGGRGRAAAGAGTTAGMPGAGASKRRARRAGGPGAGGSKTNPLRKLLGRGRSGAAPGATQAGGGGRSRRGPGSRFGRSGTKPRGGTGRRRPPRPRRRRFQAPDPRRGDTELLPDKRTPKPPKPEASPKETRPAPARRAPTPHPNRNPNHTQHSKGPSIMSRLGRMWRQHSEEELSAATRYDPETMPDYLTDLKDLVTAFQNEAAALGKMSAISQADLPVDKNVAEYIAQLQSLMHTIADGASNTVAKFIAQHEADLARHDDRRRPGEEKWNVQ